METEFCSVSLDIIGKAVFNYEFGSVTQESPVIQAVYSTLKEVSQSHPISLYTHTYTHTLSLLLSLSLFPHLSTAVVYVNLFKLIYYMLIKFDLLKYSFLQHWHTHIHTYTHTHIHTYTHTHINH